MNEKVYALLAVIGSGSNPGRVTGRLETMCPLTNCSGTPGPLNESSQKHNVQH